MREITRIGVDLAKNVIHVHAVAESGAPVTNRPLPRDKFMAWCAQLPVGCLIAIEQQSMLCIHRLREGFKEERNACTKRIRRLLAAFGLVCAQSLRTLRQALPDRIEDASNELGGLAPSGASAGQGAMGRTRRPFAVVRRTDCCSRQVQGAGAPG